MPEGINEGTIKAAEALIKDPEGVVKGAEAAASKAEETLQNARTYTRDARGRFARAVKGVTKTATVAGAGAEAASLFGNKSNNGNDSDNASTQPGASKTKSVPNPGANSPAGRIDLPSITPAEDIANNVDDSSFSDTRGIKGSTVDTGSEGISNRKLNRIISLLESILSVEKSSMRAMGAGFRNLAQIEIQGFNAQANRQQASDMERTSAGGGGGFFGSMGIQNPGRAAAGGLKSLGAAVLGSFALGALIEGAKNMEGDDAKGHPVQDTADHDKVFGTYKDKYGKRWAQMFIDEVEGQLSKKKGFQQDLADSPQAAAGDIYLAIKNLFDKSSKEDQSKLIQQIAYLLKLKPEQVQAQIVEVNKPSRQIGRTVSQAVSNALVNSVTYGVTGAQKLAGLIGGGATTTAGNAFNALGMTGIGNKLQNKGNDFTDMEMHSADQARLQMKRSLRENTSMETQYDIGRHQDAYKFTTAGTDAAEAIIGPGKFGFGKLLFGAGVGGLGMFGGEGKHDIFAYARQGDIHFNGEDGSAPKSLLDSIGKGESGSEGYDSYYAKAKIKPSKPISEMTLGEIKEWQEQNRRAGSKSTAVGKYQYIYKTLKEVQQELNLPDSTVFSPEIQDKFATKSLNNRGLQQFEQGKISAKQFQDNVAQEWASVMASNGKGVYDKDGINHATNNIAGVLASIDTESLKPQTQIASAAPVSSPVMINQGGTNISRNTTIQNASAAAPPWLQDNVMASFG